MYKLEEKDAEKASATLAEAFNDYPVFEYVMPDPAYRKSHLQHLCDFLVRLGIANGEVLAPNEEIEAVSIWIPPAASREQSAAAVGVGLLRLVPKINVKSFVRFIKVGHTKGQRRAAFVKRSCFLCDMIGVKPLSQRQGRGRKMIAAKLVDCDRRKLPCYLETSEFRNIGYYEKYGFSLIDEYMISDVNVYCLLRRPYDSP